MLVCQSQHGALTTLCLDLGCPLSSQHVINKSQRVEHGLGLLYPAARNTAMPSERRQQKASASSSKQQRQQRQRQQQSK